VDRHSPFRLNRQALAIPKQRHGRRHYHCRASNGCSGSLARPRYCNGVSADVVQRFCNALPPVPRHTAPSRWIRRINDFRGVRLATHPGSCHHMVPIPVAIWVAKASASVQWIRIPPPNPPRLPAASLLGRRRLHQLACWSSQVRACRRLGNILIGRLPAASAPNRRSNYACSGVHTIARDAHRP